MLRQVELFRDDHTVAIFSFVCAYNITDASSSKRQVLFPPLSLEQGGLLIASKNGAHINDIVIL